MGGTMPPSSGGRSDAGEPEDRRRRWLSCLSRLSQLSQLSRSSRLLRLSRLARPSSRSRKVEIVLAAGGLLAGFSLTIAGISARHATHGRAEARPSSPPAEAAPG